jgi:Rrf2 family nitric oxide-sensitive transcriptional repressor
VARLALSDRPLPVRSVAELEEIPQKFLQGVVSDLVRAGILLSQGGPGGGTQLSRPPAEIPLRQVVEVVEGDFSLMLCMEESHACSSFHGCRIHEILGEAQLAVHEVLSRHTVADLITPRSVP